MASLNKGQFSKRYLGWKIDILAMIVEPNEMRPYMFELTNTTTMDLTQTSYLTDNEDEIEDINPNLNALK